MIKNCSSLWLVFIIIFSSCGTSNIPKDEKQCIIGILCLEHAIKAFYLDTGQYPTDNEGLDALWQTVSEQWDGPYISLSKHELKDPWGNVFRYRLIGGKPFIESSGRDSKFGTDDDINSNNHKDF